ncbi:MAG: ligand-binding receptor [Phycisphaeraceae bacterium]|nr:ligand-binding receptor [Phycisphaeraceae bacterium]
MKRYSHLVRGPVMLFVLFLMGLSAQLLYAQTSEPQTAPVRLGMSTALSGPAADLGINMKLGVEVALKAHAPTSSHQYELVVFDDGYEPSRTIPNTRQLIGPENVQAIIGNVGTPTSVVSLPIITTENVCFYGAFTGAGVLRRNPPASQVFNYRASYAQETAAMVDGLIVHGKLKPSEIALFTQRDSYGQAGYGGAMEAMRRHGLQEVGEILHTRYERNSMNVENAVAQLILADHPPRAVIMVGAYAPCAKFIALAKKHGINALFLNVSFVGTQSLINALGDESEDVIITQVVPHPLSDLPLVKNYREAMTNYAPEAQLSFGTLEGYIATMLFQHAMDRVEAPLSRQKIIDGLANLGTVDIGLGHPLTLTATRHQASNQVWPTIVRNHQAMPFDWKLLSTMCESSREGGRR